MSEKQIINEVFREYVTSKQFVLTLSRNQADSLIHVVESGSSPLGSASNSLFRRGLIEMDKATTPWKYKATTAGKLTYLLLIESGLHNNPPSAPPALYATLFELMEEVPA